MSAYLTGWVWREVGLPTTAKYVLLALADQAPDDGSILVNLDTLRVRTGLGRDAIRFALKYLQDRAYIVRTRPDATDMDAEDEFRLNPVSVHPNQHRKRDRVDSVVLQSIAEGT